MSNFRGFRVHQDGDAVVGRLEDLSLDDLSPGDVVIRAQFSSVNYKDALAATGAGRIMKTFPLVGGIDVAGVIESSDDPRYAPGDPVLVTGCGLGEERDGGYAQYVRIDGDSVIPIPEGLDARQVMCLGTAGFTAGLAISRLELNGLEPERGAVAVTGATGGVGSLAVDMLSGLGYRVAAVTGKRDSAPYLESLGAAEILLRDEIDYGKRPLEAARWAGAVDNLGGETLSWLIRTTDWWGSIASIGLAQSYKLEATVMPFILRGINLLGINSVKTPRVPRLAVWARLATDLRPRHLDDIATRTVSLEELGEIFQGYLDGTVRGRTLVALES
jgi:NADPH2:quinone reductase